MENATKALLIAAAVLVAIIIISLGVSIVTSARDQINQSSNALDSAEVEAFNSKFKTYEGASVSGTKVRSLANAVIQSNQSQEDDSRKIEIYLYTGNDETSVDYTGVTGTPIVGKDATTVPTGDQGIQTGKRYYVRCITDSSTLIKKIIIKAK